MHATQQSSPVVYATKRNDCLYRFLDLRAVILSLLEINKDFGGAGRELSNEPRKGGKKVEN